MPEIWNVGTSNNINNNKLSSKVTFDVGEKFSGRIVKVGENNKEVMVKLLDGWQFVADVDGDAQDISKGFMKFQVEGFENGKLKLKIVSGNGKDSKASDDIIDSFLENEGLSKEDTELILKMIKHNIPLSRETVLKMKSINNFQNKTMINPQEVDVFIEKYLASKGLDGNSEQGKNISNSLKEFFKGFSSLSEEDILMFIENNIDFTKENIESYEKLFKGTGNLYKELKNVGSEMKELLNTLDIEPETYSNDNTAIKTKDIETNKENKIQEATQNIDEKTKLNYDKITRANVLQNIYGANNKINGESNKSNILQMLKALTSNENDIIKYAFEDVLSKKAQLDNVLGKELLNKFVNAGDKAILSILKDSMQENGIQLKDLQKPQIEQALSKYFGKPIYLNENEFNKIDDTIKYVMKTNLVEEVGNTDNPKDVSGNEKNINKDQFNKTSNVVSENSIKKEVVQEGFKGKVVETKVESNIIMKGGKLEEDFTVKGKGIIEIEELTSQQVVKDQIKGKSDEIKTIIRDILNNVNKGDSQLSEKIFSIIKNNINDFKMFNTISNEYYYMDLPLKIKEQDYPCKLMVKDNRKEGKRIDSTNVKMVVSVDTVNIGVVDGYLKVNDKSISIDMKCEELFIKPLNLGKVKLENALKSLGYEPYIYVSKKVNEAELNNCREFFNDNNISAIDRKV